MTAVRRTLGSCLSAILVLLSLTAVASAQAQPAPAARWFRGNTHTHTLNSDGDSTPAEVVRSYRELRYHFLVITDHNFVTPVDGLNAVNAAEGRFLVIAGEEVTDGAGERPVHLNLLGASRVVQPQRGATPLETLQHDIDAMRQVDGALVQINHPNFGWGLNTTDLTSSHGGQLIEVFNGHPQVNNLGGGGLPSAEAMWDEMLSSGQHIFGVASDDEHELKRPGVRTAAAPGRGWVVVRATKLSAEEILSGLRRGDFYASTGVELSDVAADERGLTVSIKGSGDTRYTVQFIGKGGKVLKEATASPARYDFNGTELYVRAKVVDSNGLCAWVQPVWPKTR